jgi:hypothetical protein
VIVDLYGKGGRVRTVAVPIWVKQGIDAWMTAAKIEKGRLLRPLSKSGKILGEELGDWAIWSVVEQSSKQIGIEQFGAQTSAGPAPSFAERTEGSRADQVSARTLVDPDHGAVSRIGSGDRRHRE